LTEIFARAENYAGFDAKIMTPAGLLIALLPLLPLHFSILSQFGTQLAFSHYSNN
jgi:hypothetical protein